MNSINTTLKYLDGDSGAQLQQSVCKQHTDAFALVLYNQSGYDATSACLGCVQELINALENPQQRIEYANEVKEDSRYNFSRYGPINDGKLLIEKLLNKSMTAEYRFTTLLGVDVIERLKERNWITFEEPNEDDPYHLINFQQRDHCGDTIIFLTIKYDQENSVFLINDNDDEYDSLEEVKEASEGMCENYYPHW